MIVSHVSMRDGLLLELARAVTGQEDRSLAEGRDPFGHGHRPEVPRRPAARRSWWPTWRCGCSTSCGRSTAWGRGSGCCLHVAGLLHEIGGFVSNRSHHKHSYYLIANSEIFGLNREEIADRGPRGPLPSPQRAEALAPGIHDAAAGERG